MGFINTGVTREDRRDQPIFYVYAYWIDGEPFYVGKGWGDRCRAHFSEFRHSPGPSIMKRKMAKLIREGRRKDIEITFFIKEVDEETAFFWEGFLIRALGRRCDKQGPLCNLTWGGDHTSTGYRHSKEMCKELSKVSKARWRDPVMYKRIKAGMKLSRQEGGYNISEEGRQSQKRQWLERKDEQIRRLQSGSIVWHPKRKQYQVTILGKYVGIFDTYFEAEQNRVNACKAARDGYLDAWLEGLRKDTAEIVAQGKELKEQKIRGRSIAWGARMIISCIRKSIKIALRADRRKLKKSQNRRERPWLVDSPYCAFVFMIENEVQYVGFGRPIRTWNLLYKNDKPEAPVKQWLDSLDELPNLHVVFVETREQAKVWKVAMIEDFDPPVNKLHTERMHHNNHNQYV